MAGSSGMRVRRFRIRRRRPRFQSFFAGLLRPGSRSRGLDTGSVTLSHGIGRAISGRRSFNENSEGAPRDIALDG